MDSFHTFDTIVIGAGSAGCVVTRRLVDAGQRVLLLEAGPPDNTPFIHMPTTFVRVIGTQRTWVYETTPQPHANGRKMYVPQGKTLGGSLEFRSSCGLWPDRQMDRFAVHTPLEHGSTALRRQIRRADRHLRVDSAH